VGLHLEGYDHDAESSGWVSNANTSETFGYTPSRTTRTEKRNVTVRDWYGNSEIPRSKATTSVTVYSDDTKPSASNGKLFTSGNDGEVSENTYSAQVCPDGVQDEGVNGGVGIYDDGCTSVSVTNTYDTSYDDTWWETTEEPTCTSSGTETEYYEWSDTDTSSNSEQTTVIDNHGNSREVTVTLERTGNAGGSGETGATRSISSKDCTTDTNSTAPPTLSLSGK
jgi:hypothetical protein